MLLGVTVAVVYVPSEGLLRWSFRGGPVARYPSVCGRARTSRSDSESQEKAAAAATERRFAYSLLEKLQQYLGSAALNMKLLVPSQNLGHRVSFRKASRDVKFFFKVMVAVLLWSVSEDKSSRLFPV